MVPDDTATVAYEAVNRLFAKEIALHVRDNDNVWIHDYHLMLLPQFLREELRDTKNNVKIGFFLHTPFPDSNDLSIMPFKDQILRGVLGSNLVGFHIQDYAHNFRRCCMDILWVPKMIDSG
jgi:trehalose 6-phosphate synthase